MIVSATPNKEHKPRRAPKKKRLYHITAETVECRSTQQERWNHVTHTARSSARASTRASVNLGANVNFNFVTKGEMTVNS